MAEPERKREKSRQLTPTWRSWLIFLVTALVVMTGSVVYLQTRPTVYTAKSVVALRPKGERPVPADTVLLTAPRYVSLATSPYVLNQVAKQLRLPANDLTAGVVVTMAAATANLTISVTLENRRATAKVANTIADVVQKRAGADSILTAQILSQAAEPKSPSGPRTLAILGSGAVAAVTVGAAAAWLYTRHMRRRARLVRGVASVRRPATPDPSAKPAAEPPVATAAAGAAASSSPPGLDQASVASSGGSREAKGDADEKDVGKNIDSGTAESAPVSPEQAGPADAPVRAQAAPAEPEAGTPPATNDDAPGVEESSGSASKAEPADPAPKTAEPAISDADRKHATWWPTT